jgi:hypothetical protein
LNSFFLTHRDFPFGLLSPCSPTKWHSRKKT